ncbi:ABC1 kinase family protein [Dyella jiangningensis]
MTRLGTTFIKLGQGLSLRWDLLPANYREALSHLSDDVPPFPPAEAIRAIERAFGASVEHLFLVFDPTPLAAASVAQVRAAKLPDGRDVVIKVIRPGIELQIQTDLRLLRRAVHIAQWFWPSLRAQQPLELVDELEQYLIAEIDMRHEAQNMRRMAPILDGLPNVAMPHVIESFATRDVLVQECSEGRRLNLFYGTPAAPGLAMALLDAYVRQIFGAGVFHADPHPGNLFVLQDGRLCLHDFGSIGLIDPASRLALGGLIEAIVADDPTAVLDASMALGFVEPQADRRRYERKIHLILTEMASRAIAEWSVAEAIWRVARLDHGEQFRLPPHLLVLLRALFLVESTVRSLDPDLDLLGVLRERGPEVARLIDATRMQGRPLGSRLAHTARQLPQLAEEFLRQAALSDGRPAITVHHRGLNAAQDALARTGNRLAIALVILGLYVSGAVLSLHNTGPQFLGHVPVVAVLAFLAATALALRLVVGVSRSGHL